MLLSQLLGREHDCHCWVRQIIGVTIGIGAIAFQQMPTSAQITPDDTLPNNSQVTRIDNIRLIWGGTQAGSNLFHSFSEFSVPTGNGAYFFNGTDIQNIFSRVTGGSVSNIDGLIAANGNANLFLINPNGIIFGNNARLNIGGSFLASTASSLKFADGKEFSATALQNAPLLSIGVPLGLQFGESPKAIVNESGYGILSIFADFFNIPPGLKVEPEKTLGLVGGDIILKEGTLRAPDGRIELGSVGSGSFVSLTPTNAGFVLGYEGVNRFQDIRLSQQSIAVTDGDSGGSIQLQGKNVTLSDGSFISANTTGSGTGGGLTVNASESVQVAGSSPDGLFLGGLRVRVTETATGKAGDMRINTPTLLVQDGAQISVGVFGSGKGGNLIVNASKEVQLVGESTNSLPSGLYSETLGTGNAGDITITTPVLLVRSGAGVGTGTSGSGKGGVLTVNASESVQLVGGTSSDNAIALGASASKTATGQAGDLKINTSVLLLKDGAQISVGTFGVGKGGNLIVNASQKVELIGESADSQFASGLFSETRGVGNAGDITIATPVLLLRDGAQIDASTRGSGKGGNLNVNASESVQLIGRSSDNKPTALLAGTYEKGDAGSLTINTRALLLQDGANVLANTFGAGKGGDLTVNASESVQLIGSASNGRSNSLAAQANPKATGRAGDIRINTSRLLLRDGSQISVGTFGAGQGGNLIINSSESIQLIGTSPNDRFASGLYY
jgi:filamentous hemagglutinin family protein